MRAKLKIFDVNAYPREGTPTQETIKFHGVAAKAYPSDGSDENNTFAKYSPHAVFELTVTNPALIGQFAVGDTFYVDFSPAPD
jgi:hypothetical protein